MAHIRPLSSVFSRHAETGKEGRGTAADAAGREILGWETGNVNKKA